jgi:hypothetical protein
MNGNDIVWRYVIMFWNGMNAPLFTRLRGGHRSHHRRNHLLPLVQLALLVAVFAAFAPAHPAAAAVPGLRRVEAPSDFNSADTKLKTAVCPAGQKVIGGGGSIDGAKGRVGLLNLTPNSDLSGYTAHAGETGGGTTEPWMVTAYALCANATAVPDLQQVVSPPSAFDSQSFKPAKVRCPAGTKLVGIGARTNGVSTSLAIVRMFPDQTAVQVGAAEVDAGTAQNWGVQAVALCVNETSAIDVQLILKIGAPTSVAQLTRHLTCPSGKLVLGGGVDTLNAPTGRVLLRGITPRTDKLGVAISSGESAQGTTQNWTQIAYMLCATP